MVHVQYQETCRVFMFMIGVLHSVEIFHTNVMSSVSDSLNIQTHEDVIILLSWENCPQSSLLNCLYFV